MENFAFDRQSQFDPSLPHVEVHHGRGFQNFHILKGRGEGVGVLHGADVCRPQTYARKKRIDHTVVFVQRLHPFRRFDVDRTNRKLKQNFVHNGGDAFFVHIENVRDNHRRVIFFFKLGGKLGGFRRRRSFCVQNYCERFAYFRKLGGHLLLRLLIIVSVDV